MEHLTCLCCGWEIDPETCHCGTEIEGHDSIYLGHTFVPMGCTCGYHDAESRKNPLRNIS